MMVYPADDPNQAPKYGVKVWYEDETTPRGILTRREHRNFYYPDRIEKYARDDRGNLTLRETVPNVDSRGKPLGIPMIHFQNKGLRFEAWDAWPLQNAINKTLIDLLAAGDLTAFRIFVSFGFIPTTDGKSPASDRSNWLTIEPGQLIGTSAKPNEASFEAIDPADLKPLIDLEEQLILWMAMVTDTPVNRFVSTRQIASDKTLKQQEGPLLSKVRNRQMRFGSAWIDCLNVARRLHNEFSLDEPLDVEARLTVNWAEAQPSAEMDRIEILQAKKSIGIPNAQLWLEAGYTQEKIAEMEAQARANASTTASTQLSNLDQAPDGGTRDGNDPSTERGNSQPNADARTDPTGVSSGS